MLKILGTTDEVNTCDCCGRKDLKDTVAMEDDETGNIVYYGCVCAAKKRQVPAKQIRDEAKSADKAKAAAERAEHERLWRIEDARYQSFLDSKVAGTDCKCDSISNQIVGYMNRFNQLQFLGGFMVARKMYQEYLKTLDNA
jgi:hypothetical protein